MPDVRDSECENIRAYLTTENWYNCGRTCDHCCNTNTAATISGVLTTCRHLEAHMPWTPPGIPKKSVGQAPGAAGGGRAAQVPCLDWNSARPLLGSVTWGKLLNISTSPLSNGNGNSLAGMSVT